MISHVQIKQDHSVPGRSTFKVQGSRFKVQALHQQNALGSWLFDVRCSILDVPRSLQTANYAKYAKGKRVGWTKTFSRWNRSSTPIHFGFAWFAYFAVSPEQSRNRIAGTMQPPPALRERRRGQTQNSFVLNGRPPNKCCCELGTRIALRRSNQTTR